MENKYNRIFNFMNGKETQEFIAWIKSPEARVIDQFFKSIENSLEDILFYVYPNQDGLKVVSVKINELLHRACAEIESQLASILDLNNVSRNTSKHIIQEGIDLLGCKQLKVEFKLTGITLEPFKDFTSFNQVPSWWTGNNKIKHARETDWHKANLESLIHAVAGVSIVLWGQAKTWYIRHDSYFDGSDFGPTVSIYPETKHFRIIEKTDATNS